MKRFTLEQLVPDTINTGIALNYDKPPKKGIIQINSEMVG